MAFTLAHGDAEIHQYRAGGGYHHVRRFDVAVHDAGRMHRLHCCDELAGQSLQIIADVTAVDAYVFAQVLPLDQLGDDECQGVVEFHVDDAAYAGMTYFLQRHRLTTQSFAGRHLIAGGLRRGAVFGQGVAQNLHRILVTAIVPHTPYRSHRARAKSGDQRIAAYEAALFQIQCA